MLKSFIYEIDFCPKFAYLYALNVLKGRPYPDSDEGDLFSPSSRIIYTCLYAIQIKKAKLCDRLHSGMLFRMIENKYSLEDKYFVQAYFDFINKKESDNLSFMMRRVLPLPRFMKPPGGSHIWSEEIIKEITSYNRNLFFSVEVNTTRDSLELVRCWSENDFGQIGIGDSLSDLLFNEFFDEIDEYVHSRGGYA